jgi:hypothetical protein
MSLPRHNDDSDLGQSAANPSEIRVSGAQLLLAFVIGVSLIGLFTWGFVARVFGQ